MELELKVTWAEMLKVLVGSLSMHNCLLLIPYSFYTHVLLVHSITDSFERFLCLRHTKR